MQVANDTLLGLVEGTVPARDPRLLIEDRSAGSVSTVHAVRAAG